MKKKIKPREMFKRNIQKKGEFRNKVINPKTIYDRKKKNLEENYE